MADERGVQSIERAFDIIEAVATSKNSAVLTEIAEKPACIKVRHIALFRHYLNEGI